MIKRSGKVTEDIMLERALRPDDAAAVKAVCDVTEDIMLERALRLVSAGTSGDRSLCYRGHHAREGIATCSNG